MLVLLAALYWAIILHQRGLRFVRTLCVAREHRWCEYDYPRWDAHLRETVTTPTVRGTPASLIGSELSSLRSYVAPAFRCAPMP
jgi:hypothetical protein